MRLTVRSLPGKQLAKIFAIATAILSVPFALILAIGALFLPSDEGGPAVAAAYLFLPLFYLVFAYLSTRLFVWIFNKVAEQSGGIPLEVDALPHEPLPGATLPSSSLPKEPPPPSYPPLPNHPPPPNHST